MKELKKQIIKAVHDATDTVDGTVSESMLNHFLDGILDKQLSQSVVIKNEVLVCCDNCKDYMTACEDCLQKYYKWKAEQQQTVL